MLDAQTANTFLLVASICTVVLTVLFAVLIGVGVWVLVEVRALARMLRDETDWYISQRRRISRSVRFMARWARLFGTRLADSLTK